MRNADHSKVLVAAYNLGTSGSATFPYTFDDPNGQYYISAQSYNVSGISFDAAAGTITLPAHCFVVITNIENAGIDEIAADDANDNISIYPNPATDYVQVSSTDVERIEVYSLTGQLVATCTGCNTIDVSSLVAGNYIVRVHTPQGIETENLMKR